MNGMRTKQESGSPLAARERPSIRDVGDFWCWLNTWGDEREREFSTRSEREAYRQCISDAMKALREAGVDFEQVEDAAWRRWTRW